MALSESNNNKFEELVKYLSKISISENFMQNQYWLYFQLFVNIIPINFTLQSHQIDVSFSKFQCQLADLHSSCKFWYKIKIKVNCIDIVYIDYNIYTCISIFIVLRVVIYNISRIIITRTKNKHNEMATLKCYRILSQSNLIIIIPIIINCIYFIFCLTF